MHYTIPVAGDTSGLTESLHPKNALDATGTVPTYLGFGATLGALAGLVFKKHAVLLTLGGAVGGYLYGSKLAKDASK